MTKECKKCKKIKPLEEFCKGAKYKNGRQNICKKCHENLYYHNNPRKEEIKQYRRNYYRKFRKIVDDIKIHLGGCAICNETTPVCLDFHHKIKDSKLNAVYRLFSVKAFTEEIEKCCLLCSNCHRKVHNNLLDCSNIPFIKIENIKQFLTEDNKE